MNLITQRAVSGRPRQVRCQLQAAPEDVLRQELPPSQDLDTAIATTRAERKTRRRDMDWVRVEPIVELAHTWLEQHPGTSKRQLSILLSARIREMGYSRATTCCNRFWRVEKENPAFRL
jgi:hypothetical protein